MNHAGSTKGGTAEKAEKTWMRITDEVSLPSDEKSKDEKREKRKPERGARILVTDGSKGKASRCASEQRRHTIFGGT